MSKLSVCVAVYKAHAGPNVASMGTDLPAAAGPHDYELVVALNGIDAEAAGVPAGARTVDMGVNRGVAPGWNGAAQAATGDVLVFANDDARIGPGALAMLADVLEKHPAAGVVGPGGTRWDIAGAEHRSFLDLEGLSPGSLVECEVVYGYLFACRRSTFELVGGMDDFYAPCSWEEIDFCTAARAAGLHNYAVAGVGVAHEWGISTRQPPWRRIRYDGRSETLRSIHRRNRRHFQDKWSDQPLEPVGS